MGAFLVRRRAKLGGRVFDGRGIGGAIVRYRPTPGPWAAEPQLTPDGRMGDAWNVISDDWPAVYVAEVRREADALLISAAPALLALVRDISAAEVQSIMDFDEYQSRAILLLRGAGIDP
jgi:hypothetical protein